MKNIEYNFFKIANSKYNEDINNKLYEEKIKEFGIEKVCVDENIINNIPNTFNIELPSLNIYDQGDSERCWICAGINLIKNNVVKNLDIVENDFKISTRNVGNKCHPVTFRLHRATHFNSCIFRHILQSKSQKSPSQQLL